MRFNCWRNPWGCTDLSWEVSDLSETFRDVSAFQRRLDEVWDNLKLPRDASPTCLFGGSFGEVADVSGKFV